MRITSDTLKKLRSLTREERRYATRNRLDLFLVYYFPHLIQSPFSEFHYSMSDDIRDLFAGIIKEVAWFMFRGSAKTSLSKAAVIQSICYGYDDFGNVISYDKGNAERFLFDVVTELQTNELLRADFGELYNSKRTNTEATQKRITDFVTNPIRDDLGNILKRGARWSAHSTQESMRGRVHGGARPSFLIFDDFETMRTIRSSAVTKSIRENIDEAITGLDHNKRRILWLGNYISTNANVQAVIDRGSAVRTRIVPIMSVAGLPTWPERFTPESVEALKQSMWSPNTGNVVFDREMMCNPLAGGSEVFKSSWFKACPQPKEWERIQFTIDTASSKEGAQSEGDFAGFCLNFVQKNGDWHIRAWHERLSPSELVKRIIALVVTWKLRTVAWEDTAHTRALEIHLNEQMKAHGVSFTLVWLKTGGRSKEDRIRTGLVYRYETERIYHIDSTCEDLEDEALAFPHGSHDDILDAVAYQADVIPVSAPRVRIIR